MQRFWCKVDKSGGPLACWTWKAHIKKGNGYGQFSYMGRAIEAHRVAYELTNGSIPEGREVDHLCKNTVCVNPTHLEAVTHRENLLRANTVSGINARKTHCPKGHALSGENLAQWGLRVGRRQCRICANQQARERTRNGHRTTDR